MTSIPLAERLRPRSLDEVIGQQHLLGSGKPLRVAFESGEPHSMILWGPPGVGKTTLARLMADGFNAEFIALSAVLSGVKDIREAVERAQVMRANSGRRTILFVDEVHRFNKSQQDAFLPHVESGLFTFIGATTENPSFEVNGALLSRASVYVLKSLTDDDLDALMYAPASTRTRRPRLRRADAKAMLIASADGDGRKLLNNLEIVARAAAAKRQNDGRCGAAGANAWATPCAASTRVATPSTTRFRRCTSRCAAPTRMRRCTGWCACSTAAPTRATWRGASSAWPARISAWPIRARCASRSTRPKPTSGLVRPKASWRWPRR